MTEARKSESAVHTCESRSKEGEEKIVKMNVMSNEEKWGAERKGGGKEKMKSLNTWWKQYLMTTSVNMFSVLNCNVRYCNVSNLYYVKW